jgi:5-methylcytosine-specific restriction endonuclease McrA
MDGRLESRNGQDTVRCLRCKRLCYNAPRTETGKEQRSVKSRPDLKFGQRERVLLRDNGRCLICGRGPEHNVILHIAHALSVSDAKDQGLGEEFYMDEENLFAACEECNLGIGSVSLSPRLMAKLLYARVFKAKNGWPL